MLFVVYCNDPLYKGHRNPQTDLRNFVKHLACNSNNIQNMVISDLILSEYNHRITIYIKPLNYISITMQ